MNSISFKSSIAMARECIISWTIHPLAPEDQEKAWGELHARFYKVERGILEQFLTEEPSIHYAHKIYDYMATHLDSQIASVWYQVVTQGKTLLITFAGKA